MAAIERLKELTGCKNIFLVNRGNSAIKIALEYFSQHGFKTLLIQDQGGWMRYEQFGDKKGFQVVKVKTDKGVLLPEELKKYDAKTLLLYGDPAGYFAEQPVAEIMKAFAGKIILDVSGSIGTKRCNAAYGDALLGSFGNDKAVNVGYGGFIGLDGEIGVKDEYKFDDNYSGKLDEILKNIHLRLKTLWQINKKIKNDLKNFEVIHKDKEGINVVVKFKDEAEKAKIIDYCNKNGFEFTECPRYIRVMEKAISVEVKRL